ncbi:MAG: glycosyltransferase family 4 protein [Fuerstiella sp.]|nr:glycosyltransferase family 4 protein [Fuerstiella sp.]
MTKRNVKKLKKLPVLIVISPVVSGVVSWALRVQEAFARNENYDVRLVSTHGPGDGTIRFDHTYERPRQIIPLLETLGSGVIIPNYMWDLFYPMCEAIASGREWRILGYCRADSKKEYYDPLQKRADLISHFIAVSPTCASKLESLIPSRGSDITMLPTGVYVSPDRGDLKFSGPLRMVYAGRVIQHQKRILDIALIAHRLDDRNVDYELQIIGDGKEEHLLRACLETQVAQGKVRFCGRIHPEQMNEVWKNTDVVLLCSEFEGTSNSILEAMGFGCIPVVTRTDSGVEGIINHGVNGLLFEIGDVQKATDHLQRIVCNDEFRRKVCAAAMETIVPFSMDRHVDVLSQVFDGLMRLPPRRQQAKKRLTARGRVRIALQSSPAVRLCRSFLHRIRKAFFGQG